jgi:MATE family multidrug resistance protein
LQGLGRQAVGFRINLVSFYVVAIPSAYLLGFLLHWGVEGLYCGLILGATCQATAYFYYTSNVDWEQEAQIAVCRVQAVAASAAPPSEP